MSRIMMDPYRMGHGYDAAVAHPQYQHQMMHEPRHLGARVHSMPQVPSQYYPAANQHRHAPYEAPRMHSASAHNLPPTHNSQQYLSYQQRYCFDPAGPSMKSSYGMQQEIAAAQRVPRSPSPSASADAMNRYPQQQGASNASTAFPRSASEALFDTSTKFRQLPCRTFISVGTCPYRERCVYLHDPRCICREAKTKTRRKNKEDVVMDALFWPVMPYPMVAAKLDANRQPHVIQPYSVPLPQADQYRRHDTAVYSMWMHFVDFCLANSEASGSMYADASACFSAPDVATNSYTQLPRLAVFRALSRSNGHTLNEEDLKLTADEKKRLEAHVPAGSLDEIDSTVQSVPQGVPKSKSPITVTGFDASPMRAQQLTTPFGPSSYGSTFSELQPVPSFFKSIWEGDGSAVEKSTADSSSPTGVDTGSPPASSFDLIDQKLVEDNIQEVVHGFSVDAIISN